jgi:hypothetical protein
MMDQVFLWFVPVALLIVFIVLLLRHHRESIKPTLFTCEPLGFLAKSWAVARIVGEEGKVDSILRASCACAKEISEDMLLGQLLAKINVSGKQSQACLLHIQKLSSWSCRWVIEANGGTRSYVIGPISEVILHCNKYRNAALDMKAKERFIQEERKAGEHGFLTIAFAEHASIANEPMPQHSFLGHVILEPKLDNDSVRKLKSSDEEGGVCFVSVLPLALTGYLFAKVFPGKKIFAVTAQELSKLGPDEQELKLDDINVVAEADFKTRYAALRHWSHKYECQKLSRNPEDKKLPGKHLDF